MIEKHLYLLRMAFSALMINRVRSFLTALGIIFGVAAVISMLAIGRGAKQEILEQMKQVGVNNIVIKQVVDKEDPSEESENTQKNKKYSSGLCLDDVACIQATLSSVSAVSPEVEYETHVSRNGHQKGAKLNGVSPSYFALFNLKTSEGKLFSEAQERNGNSVCVIGFEIKNRFFSGEDPIGKQIKCGDLWMEVIGVLEARGKHNSAEKNAVSSINEQVFAPMNTLLLRYKNRGALTEAMIKSSADDEEQKKNTEGPGTQLDRITVQVSSTELLEPTAEILGRMLNRRHNNQADYEIIIPELLLKQEQKTKDIFNLVLGVIAGISLLVGGIGIMNIMLASVLERVREIGLRLALGARKREIEIQFMAEAAMISISGGLAGIVLGISISIIIQQFTGIQTIVSFFSIALSFLVSATVGILFGYIPAKRAAAQDPVTSLRYE